MSKIDLKIFFFWNNILSFAFSIVLLSAKVKYIFDTIVILNEFVGFYRTNSFNFRCIVASAKNAHIDELVFCQSKIS